jgi:nitroreductase
MSLVSQVEHRRALRALSEDQIPRQTLLRLVEAACLAPSCANSQPWRILTVDDPERLAALKAALTPGNYWALKAPAMAAFATRLEWDARLDHGRDYAFFDLGMAAMNYQLQAVEEGLIAHPIAGFDAAAAKLALGIPEGTVLLTLIILGYPGDASHLSAKHLAAEGAARHRKPLEELSAFDTWDSQLEPPPDGGL